MEHGQIGGTEFPAQSAPARDIKSMTAGVNDAVNIHAAPNVIQIASAQDGHRQTPSQRSQRLSHCFRKPRVLRMTNNGRKRAIIVEKDSHSLTASRDLLNMPERRWNHDSTYVKR